MNHRKQICCIICSVLCLLLSTTYLVKGTVDAAVQKVQLNHTSISLALGKQKRLSLDGTQEKVTWSSSDTKIVRVNKKGIVKTRRVGTATVTATAGNKTYTCKVNVKKPVIIMEEYGNGYHSALFSDGFMIEAYASNGELKADNYQDYYLYAAYDYEVGAVYEIPLKIVTVKGYNSVTGKNYKRIPFATYSADWCQFQKDMYKYLDFDKNLQQYGKSLSMADGYLAFKKSAVINALKYNDGVHKVTIFL